MTKRVYIRAVVCPVKGNPLFEIPMWKPGFWFELSKWDVPAYERSQLHPGFRCNVTINADAETADQLNVTDWSLD